MSSIGPTRASSHGARSKAGAGASPYGHKSEPTIPWVQVVPDFGGLLMKMSSVLATNRSHRRLSSFTCLRRRGGRNTEFTSANLQLAWKPHSRATRVHE